MDIYKFEQLLKIPEGPTIDFKSAPYDFDGEEVQGDKKRKRAKFVKDIISLYNTPHNEESYIIIGVKKYQNGAYDLLGVEAHLDDAIYQDKVIDFVSPHPIFQYCPFDYKGKTYGIFIISTDPKIGPCVPLEDTDSILRKHQIYIRHGSQNASADSSMQKKVHEYFRESNPPKQLLNAGEKTWDLFTQATDNFDLRYNYILALSPLQLTYDCNIEAIGVLPWSFVFDFSPDSAKESGLLFKIQDIINKNRSLHLVTKLDSLSMNLQTGTYWYFARGFVGRETTLATGSWKEWRQSYGSDIIAKIKSLASASDSRPFKIIIFWDSDSLFRHLESLLGDILSHLGNSTEIIFVSLTSLKTADEIEAKFECRVLSIPLNQICSGIQHRYTKAKDKEYVYIPSHSGSPIELSPQKLNWIEEQFEVLHESTGYSSDETVEPQKALRDFLRGKEPSWYSLAIHCDIDREKYRSLSEIIRSDLKQRQTYRINLYHAPGAGGTTLSRRIIWDLHKDYPCLVAKYTLDESSADRIQYIFTQTSSPVLIEVDGSRISDSQLEVVYDLLVTRHIPALLLHVQRRGSKQIENPRSKYLDSLLSQNETEILGRQLCGLVPEKANAIRNSITQENIKKTPFILSLIAFEDNFLGIDHYVKARIENLNEPLQRILIFISLCYFYGQQTIPAQIFAPILEIPSNKIVYLENMFPEIVLDLLMETNKGFWRPVHQIIAETCLKLLLTQFNNDVRQWNQRLSKIAQSFVEFLTNENNELPERIMEIVRRVFVYRESAENFSTDNKKFSQLIEDIPEPHGQLELLNFLKKSFPLEAHFYAHLGRFYAYKMRQFDDAINCMNQAIEIQQNDNVLHHIKGIVIREKLYEYFEKQIPLNEITELASRASECFKRARELSPKNEHGYISEIEMIIRIVEYASREKESNQSNSDISNIAKASMNPWLLEATERAEGLLDDIKRNRGGNRASKFEENCLANLNKLYGNYSKAIEKWQNLLSRKDIYSPPIRRQIVRTYLARANRSWNALKQSEIKQITELLKANLNQELANEKNLRLWIQAIRWLEIPPSLDSILEQVAYWRNNTGDIDAIFYQYVLNILLRLETGSSKATEQARTSVEDCINLAAKLRYHTWSYEWLGEGRGINRLIHQSLLGGWSKSSDFWQNPKSLMRVRGVIEKIKGPESGKIELDFGLKAFFVPSKSNHVKNRDENTSVTGFLGFSYDGLRLWEVENA